MLPPIVQRVGALSFFAALFLADSEGSDWSLRVWQTDEGLANNQVNSVVQTSDGYLWVATPVGVARFDGNRFEEIASSGFIGPPHHGIVALQRGRSGCLWLGTDRGAVVGLNSSSPRVVTPAEGLPDLVIETLVEDAEDAVWVAYIGGRICRIKDGKVTNMDAAQALPWGRAGSVAVDTQGRVWLARGGEVGILHDEHFDALQHVQRVATRLAPSSHGGIWACSGQELLYCQVESVSKSMGEFHTDRASVEPTVLLEDHTGAVWIGTSYGGLFRYDGSRFEQVETSHPQILSLTEDREGSVWVGTRGGGLNRLHPRAGRLEGVATGLPVEAVRSVCEDTDGVIWAVTANGQVVHRVDGEWSVFSNIPDWEDLATCVASDPRGGVWIGTRRHRLFRWTNGRSTYVGKSRGLASATILTLLVTSKGDVWMGGENPAAVQCLHGRQFLNFALPPDPRNVRAMVEDAAGNIWVGTSKGLLLRIEGSEMVNETPKTSASHSSIRCLSATPDGSLWIGYAGGGLGRFKDGRFARILQRNGLFDVYISQILDDGRGSLWFGCDHGIFKVRLSELNAVAEGYASRVQSIHYGRGEGFPNLQAELGVVPNALCSKDGLLWLPMRSALAVVNPEKLRENSEPPPVLIKEVVADEQTVAHYDGVLPPTNARRLQTPNLELHLEPQHRQIQFDFTALSFNAPENIHFRYQLQGYDHGWVEADARRSANYPHLASGNYVFRVTACNGDGIWNESGAAVAIAVAPFVWERWWFRAAALAAFSFAVAAVVRYVSFRRLRTRLLVLQQQTALDQERARLARDLHDDLGSRLTEIVLLSGMALEETASPEKAGERVQQIATAARTGIKSLDETVWAVNPRNDTLPHLINYLSGFAVSFLEAADIRLRIDAPDVLAPRAISAEARHHVLLVAKEALNNIVRHAHAGEVSLRVNVTEDSADITIEDNGCGFDQPPDDALADGLRNMRQRMQEIGGRLDLHSAPGAGTRITFQVPAKPVPAASLVSTS
jgi:signal transduction histidine kinase/ligand-binding sensor domain-containing protein